MATIEESTLIGAPRATVWEILTSVEAYRHWNPFIELVSGRLREGARPTLRIAPPGRRPMTFRPLVVDATPQVRLAWVGKLGMRGLCDAEHEFRLEAVAGDMTLLTQRETFRGLLVPMLGGMLEPTRRGFESMNAALRERAEQAAA